MKLNRKWMAAGLVITGLAAGTLAGGGVALASARGTPGPARAAVTVTASAAPMPPDSSCGGSADMPGMWSGPRSVLAAAAAYLGLTQAQLHTQLEAGRSLAQVASERGKPVSGLKAAILAAITSQINADHALTAGQKQAVLRMVQSHLDMIINFTRPGPAR
jgi:hypothetical protein